MGLLVHIMGICLSYKILKWVFLSPHFTNCLSIMHHIDLSFLWDHLFQVFYWSTFLLPQPLARWEVSSAQSWVLCLPFLQVISMVPCLQILSLSCGSHIYNSIPDLFYVCQAQESSHEKCHLQKAFSLDSQMPMSSVLRPTSASSCQVFPTKVKTTLATQLKTNTWGPFFIFFL